MQVSASHELIQQNINGHNVEVMKITLDGNTKVVMNAVANGSQPKSLDTFMNEK